MATLLDDKLVADALQGLDEWTGGPDRISRSVTVADPEALVVAVAETADTLDHHPEVQREGGAVTFVLWTHSQGGVTELDIALASRIDDLVLTTQHLVRDVTGHVHAAGDGAATGGGESHRLDAGPIAVPDADPNPVEPQPGNAPAAGMNEQATAPDPGRKAD
jgi:4a-hydroxytetrahydrobiopterin dehydratase